MAKEKIKINWQLTGWLARDEAKYNPGDLFLYSTFPTRDFGKIVGGFWYAPDGGYELPRELFPELTWNDEPVYVKLTIEVLQ